MSESMQPVEAFTIVESIFVRQRNALLLRAQMTPIYTDYYLHMMEQKLRTTEKLDNLFKDLAGFFILHMVARPWAENIAWTANLRAPRVNAFITGSSLEEQITGRIFTEDVREPDRNFLYSQIAILGKEPRTSTVEVTSDDPREWVETYYSQSEQRPCRAFRFENEEYCLISAQPDCDLDWLASLTNESAAEILKTEETKVLETRKFRFHCGCTLDRILPTLGAWKNKPDELFGDLESLNIQCPRCAAKYVVTRDMI